MSPPWSYCPHCGHTLSAIDNIPVFSYIFLRGKCRYCKGKISPRYITVELLTAGLFVLTLHQYPRISSPFAVLGLATAWIFAAFLIVISFIDLEFTIIPNKIVYPGLVVGFLLAICSAVIQADIKLLLHRVLGAIFGAGVIILIAIAGKAVFRKEAMGTGDVRLMAMIGMYLGWLPHIFVTLVSAAFLGSIVGLILILVRRGKMDSVIPFGPFLSAGALLSMLYGENIWIWYRHLMGL